MLPLFAVTSLFPPEVGSLVAVRAERTGSEFIGIFLAPMRAPMAVTLRIESQPVESKPLAVPQDCSVYPLTQLLRARHKLLAEREHKRARLLEEEIQRRCAGLHRKSAAQAADGSGGAYRLYGVMAGLVFLMLCSGPFIAVEFLSLIGVVPDASGDGAFLTGLWAVVTLPFAMCVYLIGAIVDAERIARRLNL